jgi:hypothetical protein
MKRGLGISLLGALFAGVHLTSGPRLESGRSAVPPLMAAPLQEPGPVGETCEAFESPSGGLGQDASAQDFLDKGEITAPVQRFLGRQAAGQLTPAILPGDSGSRSRRFQIRCIRTFPSNSIGHLRQSSRPPRTRATPMTHPGCLALESLETYCEPSLNAMK